MDPAMVQELRACVPPILDNDFETGYRLEFSALSLEVLNGHAAYRKLRKLIEKESDRRWTMRLAHASLRRTEAWGGLFVVRVPYDAPRRVVTKPGPDMSFTALGGVSNIKLLVGVEPFAPFVSGPPQAGQPTM